MKVLQDAIRQYQTNMHNLMYPPCFSGKEEYADWIEAENLARTEPRRFVCRDCTPAYQALMKQKDRCLIPDVPVRYIIRGK